MAARLHCLVSTTPTSAEALGPEAAVRELLRGRGVYEVDSLGVDLAPKRPNLMSLLDLPSSLIFCRQRFALFARRT